MVQSQGQAMKMAGSILLVASLLVLPSLVVCDYPWPDNVTQHKGYIQVSFQAVISLQKTCEGGARTC